MGSSHLGRPMVSFLVGLVALAGGSFGIVTPDGHTVCLILLNAAGMAGVSFC